MRHAMPMRSTGHAPPLLFALAVALAIALPAGAADNGKTVPTKKPDASQEAAMLQALLGDMGRPIGPAAEALAPIKDKLAKEIKVQFLATPLDRVIEFLQRESGITMLIDRKATGDRSDDPVSLEAEKMTIKDALDWACLATETDWDVIKGVVVVSTTRAIELRQRTTKVYDVRGLIYRVPNFTGAPEFDLNSALSNTSSGGSSGGAQSATTLFSDEDTEGEAPTYAESVEQLATLIQDTIGEQSEWQAYGGELSSLREITGNLIIKTTPRNHEAIAKLLSEMAASTEKMVQVDTRYVLVKSKVLEDLIAKNDGQLILAADKVDAFIAAVSDAATGNKRLGGTRMVMFNGQRTHLSANNATSFLSDIEPVVDTASVDPTQSVLVSGTKTDVEATVAQGGKSIVMTFRAGVVTSKQLRQVEIPTGGRAGTPRIKQTGTINGTVAPAGPGGGKGKDKPKDDKGNAGPATVTGNIDTTGKITDGVQGADSAATVQLDLPEQEGVNYLTSVSIPNGGAVVLTGSSTMIQSGGGDDAEIVVIIRASSKEKAAEPVKAEPAKK